MKALIGLGGAAAVLTTAGIEGFSSGMAALAAVGCWAVSGWLVD